MNEIHKQTLTKLNQFFIEGNIDYFKGEILIGDRYYDVNYKNKTCFRNDKPPTIRKTFQVKSDYPVLEIDA